MSSRTYTIIKKAEEISSSESDYSSSSQSGSGRSLTKTILLKKKNKSKKKKSNNCRSLKKSKFKKPVNGSIQENFTKQEIKDRLIDYIPLSLPLDTADKKVLLNLKPYKTWIKYYNVEKRQFRVGGLLTKVDPEFRYLMLTNTKFKLCWSVNLKTNVLFIPDPEIEKQKEKDQRNCEKLLKLYKDKKLTLK
jgi:hypothetical protein